MPVLRFLHFFAFFYIDVTCIFLLFVRSRVYFCCFYGHVPSASFFWCLQPQIKKKIKAELFSFPKGKNDWKWNNALNSFKSFSTLFFLREKCPYSARLYESSTSLFFLVIKYHSQIVALSSIFGAYSFLFLMLN